MEDPKQFFEEYKQGLRSLREAAPPALEGFNSFYQKVMAEGALEVKTKELIALAVGVAVQCANCIILHTRGAAKAGANPEEIMEAASVGVVMGGGPAFTYLPLVKKTLDEL
ncbi:MAG: hypothetical protein PWP04_1485 [Candidatus Atribacteria bacterium]|nr:hypothetical protein [Candidatus Atribacteria bacterium]